MNVNPATSRPTIADLVGRDGFAFVHDNEMRGVLEAQGLAEWDAFAASWDDLGLDTYMADGGRYRRRRHAVFSATAGGIERLEHRPHYQSRDYNALNGGVARWFDPVTEAVERDARVPRHAAHVPARVRHAVAGRAGLGGGGAPVPHRGATGPGGSADAGGDAPGRGGLGAGAAGASGEHRERRDHDPRSGPAAAGLVHPGAADGCRLGRRHRAFTTG